MEPLFKGIYPLLPDLAICNVFGDVLKLRQRKKFTLRLRKGAGFNKQSKRANAKIGQATGKTAVKSCSLLTFERERRQEPLLLTLSRHFRAGNVQFGPGSWFKNVFWTFQMPLKQIFLIFINFFTIVRFKNLVNFGQKFMIALNLFFDLMILPGITYQMLKLLPKICQFSIFLP